MMDKHSYFRPSALIGSFVFISLTVCWVMSMYRIDLVTWTIGAGPGGSRVFQFGMTNGSVSLFLGESGLFRQPGLHYDSRIFTFDEERSTWFPEFLSFNVGGAGLNIEIALWFLLLACVVCWLLWIVQSRILNVGKEKQQNKSDMATPRKPSD